MIPEDSRKTPSWVSRPLRGSQDNGNGGWTPLGIMGKDLTSDLLAETWRLPSLFPNIPNAVNTLMDELENLGHRNAARGKLYCDSHCGPYHLMDLKMPLIFGVLPPLGKFFFSRRLYCIVAPKTPES